MTTIQKIIDAFQFNNGKGFIGLYLTKKEIKTLKNLGISEDTTIAEAFQIINNQ